MDSGYRWNEWNIGHIGEHGVNPEEAEYVIDFALAPYPEKIGNNKWRVWG